MFWFLEKNNKNQTTVHRKSTYNGVYLYWDLFAPNMWKRATFKTLLLTVQTVCSEETLLKKDIEHLEKVQKQSFADVLHNRCS